jgi:septal ring factor EnvC (AmiA/AmiB activator)
LRSALEEERKKLKREFVKQEKTIKELEKQLAEERENTKALQATVQDTRRTLNDLEGKYKFEVIPFLSFKSTSVLLQICVKCNF